MTRKASPFSIKHKLRQRTARMEVVHELRTNPFGGYGLYHLMDDAGLLSHGAKEDLAPLIANVEHRLSLNDEDLQIRLPLEFEPITDVEYDTLTYVIAEAIRRFIRDLPHIGERLQLAELMGINDTLERHLGQTSSLKKELSLEQVLVPILQTCGEDLPHYISKQLIDVREGDYFEVRNLARSRRFFPSGYVKERRLNRGEIVRLDEIWKKGYMRARRLNHKSRYTRKWKFFRLRKTLSRDNTLAVVYREEGRLYRLRSQFKAPVARFIHLFTHHSVDYSYNPDRYQPLTGNRGAG